MNSILQRITVSVFFLFKVLFLIPFTLSAQSYNIDSLKREIRNAKNDSIKIQLYFEWDAEIYNSDYKLDIKLNTKIIELCKINLKRENVSVNEKKFYERCLSIAHNNVGLALSNQGIYPEALSNFQISVQLSEKAKDTVLLSNAYNNIGVVYWNRREFKKAEKYFQLCLAEVNKTDDKSGTADVYNNMGLVYKDQKLYDKAMESFTHCLEIVKHDSTQLVTPNAYTNIGLLYFDNKDYAKALIYFTKAQKYFKQLGYNQGIADTEIEIGKLYEKLNDFSKACFHCENAKRIGTENQLLTVLREANKCLYQNYRNNGNWKTALQFHEAFIDITDTILTLSSAKDLERIELKFEYENKAIADSLKVASERMASEQKSKHERTQRYFLYGGLLLVLGFAIFIFNRFKVTQKQKRIIEMQQIETKLAKAQIEEKSREILDSITYAKRLQDAILPSKQTLLKYFPEHFILYLPKDIVAGDFYWLEAHGDQLFFTVADCTGHGVPGAMVSVVCSNALNRAVQEFGLTNPAKILDKARELVLATFESSDTEVRDGMDISIFALNLSTRKLKWAGANNPFWYKKFNDNTILEIKADKQPVGRYTAEKPFTSHEIQMEKGDIIYLFTDGYPDQFGGSTESKSSGKKLKTVNMKKLVTSICGKNLEEQGAYLETSFEKWKGDLEQLDDVCVAGIKIA